jgi:hypothetical protein
MTSTVVECLQGIQMAKEATAPDKNGLGNPTIRYKHSTRADDANTRYAVMARSSTQLPTNTYTINASACLLAAYAYLFTLMDFYALLMLLTFAACLCTSSYAYGFLCLFMHAYVCYLFAYGS